MSATTDRRDVDDEPADADGVVVKDRRLVVKAADAREVKCRADGTPRGGGVRWRDGEARIVLWQTGGQDNS